MPVGRGVCGHSTGTCVCKPPYLGEACDKRCPIIPLQNGSYSAPCTNHGRCTNEGTCVCDAGWIGEGCSALDPALLDLQTRLKSCGLPHCEVVGGPNYPCFNFTGDIRGLPVRLAGYKKCSSKVEGHVYEAKLVLYSIEDQGGRIIGPIYGGGLFTEYPWDPDSVRDRAVNQLTAAYLDEVQALIVCNTAVCP